VTIRGKKPKPTLLLGGSTPEVSEAYKRRHDKQVSQTAYAGYEHSDVTPEGDEVRGNLNEYTTEFTFKERDVAYLVPHDFGHVVRNWCVVDKTGCFDVWRDPSRGESTQGVWLVCSKDNQKVRIRFDGQRHRG